MSAMSMHWHFAQKIICFTAVFSSCVEDKVRTPACQRAFALCCKVIAFSWKEKKNPSGHFQFTMRFFFFFKGDTNSLSLHRPLDSVWFSLSQTRPFKARQRWISSKKKLLKVVFFFSPTLIDTFQHDQRSFNCTTWMTDESSVDEKKMYMNIFEI